MDAEMAVRVAVPISAVGYGANEETLNAMVAARPDVVAVDAGSTDSGPYYLGSGNSNKATASVRRDLRLILAAGRSAGVPVVIGNAGTSGARPHLARMLGTLHEAARDEGLRLSVAVVHSELEKGFVLERLRAGAVRPLTGVHELAADKVEACTHIVAQMGVEPYLRAFELGTDVVLAGRSCDTAIIGSFPIWKGCPEAQSLHMAKVAECGALCAIPSTGRDGIMGIVSASDFVIETANPSRRVTPASVAAHMIYEAEHPYLQEEPGGTQNFSQMRIEQVTERSVRITGSLYHRRAQPTLKLEGSAPIGFRSFLIGGLRDPFLLRELDAYIQGVNCEVRQLIGSAVGDYEVDWKVYGRDAVMGSMEPNPSLDRAHEVGVLVQVLAATQESAHDICQFTEARMIGFSYRGTKTRTANVAFPMSPLIQDSGPVFRFEVFHVTELARQADLADLFPIEVVEVGGSEEPRLQRSAGVPAR